MESDKLTEDLVQIILERIDSVPHLEALILIQEAAPRGLSAETVAARLYVTDGVARAIVQDLERRGFVARSDSSFMLDSAPENVVLVRRLAVSYRHNVYRVASLIHARPSRAVREFAKAFDMKGREK